MKLTDTTIARLTWKAKAYTLRHSARGVQLVVYPRGTKTWQLRSIHADGRQRVITMGHWPALKCTGARRAADDYRRRLAAGEEVGSIGGSARVTLRTFAARWLKDVAKDKRKNLKPLERWLKVDILPVIGGKAVANVTPGDIQAIVYGKRDQGRKAAAAVLLGTLKRLFRYAVSLGIVEKNPTDRTLPEFIGGRKARQYALGPAEIQKFFQHACAMGPRMEALAELILLTLCRKSELMYARWGWLDREAQTLEIPAEFSKSGNPHVIYLSPRAMDLLEARWPLDAERPGSNHSHSGTRRVQPDEFIFPSQSSRTQPMDAATLNKAMKRVHWNLPHFTPHDLRRTACTLLYELGYKSEHIEKSMNHKVAGVKGVYNKAQYAGERKKMLEEWAEWLRKLREA